MCICSTHCLQFRLEKSGGKFGVFFCLETGNRVLYTPQCVVRRIYGDKASDMVDGLMKKPVVAVPLVLRRLRAKLDEWRDAQKNYNRVWRDQCDKNFAKWTQSQAASFRQVDARKMRTKTLLNEADTAAEEVGLSVSYCVIV